MTTPTSDRTLGPEAVRQFHISGMHCGSCVALVEETLLETDGIRSASVDLADEKAVVTFDPSVTDVRAIVLAIDEVGYQATPLD